MVARPQTVVRQIPMKITFSLQSTGWNYRGFPELRDKFELKTAQRVRISYRVTIWTPKVTRFYTRLRIDGQIEPSFIFMTCHTQERTHFAMNDIWLSKGWHYIDLEYCLGDATSGQPANGKSYHYNELKIEYLEY